MPTAHPLHDAEPQVAEQFETIEQQREANLLGMWLFLATEMLLFGGLFMAYVLYYVLYPEAFSSAGQHLHWELGTLNTVILLGSGFTMALAEQGAHEHQRKVAWLSIVATIALGLLFLSLKGYEYYSEFQEKLVPFWDLPFHYEGPQPAQAKLFFVFYYGMTALHAVHMAVGLGMLMVVAFIVRRWREPFRIGRQVQIAGLYWAFVDIVWIFVFTLLYLVRP